MTMIAPSMDWTEAAVGTLTTMLGDGRPYSEIAALLGTTRNACIGKASRLGLRSGRVVMPTVKAPRPKTPPHSPLAAPSLPKVQEAPPPIIAAPAPQPPPASGRGVSFMRLRLGQCRFIPDRPAGAQTIYCGESVARADEPYCSVHRAICWAGKPPKDLPKPMPSPSRRRAA